MFTVFQRLFKNYMNELRKFYLCYMISKTILRKVPVVQLRPVNPAAHVHNPSVGRHLALIQLGEHTCEQFVPKCPSSQA